MTWAVSDHSVLGSCTNLTHKQALRAEVFKHISINVTLRERTGRLILKKSGLSHEDGEVQPKSWLAISVDN